MTNDNELNCCLKCKFFDGESDMPNLWCDKFVLMLNDDRAELREKCEKLKEVQGDKKTNK